MTDRERLIAAISHEQPDMVPIDLGGTVDSSIVVEGYEKLKKHFGVEAGNELCHRMMRVIKVDERILRALDIDTRSILPGAPVKGGRGGPWTSSIPRPLGCRTRSSRTHLLLRSG